MRCTKRSLELISRRRRLRHKRDPGRELLRLAGRRRYVGLAQLSGDGGERRLGGGDVRGGDAAHLIACAFRVEQRLGGLELG